MGWPDGGESLKTARQTASYSSSRPKESRRSYTVSVVSTIALMGKVSRGRAGVRPEGKPIWDDPSGLTDCLWAVAPYSSSLPKARRQSSTASVKQSGCADGSRPPRGSSSTKRETCMGRPATAGTPPARTDAGVAFKLTPKGKYTILHSFCSQEQLRRWGESLCRADLRPEGKTVRHDRLRRGQQQLRQPLHICGGHIQAHSMIPDPQKSQRVRRCWF